MKSKSRVKAGRISFNHNQTLRVRTGLKAGRWNNHNQTLKVRTSVKAGAMTLNHNQTLKVRTGLKAGGIGMNERLGVIYPKK